MIRRKVLALLVACLFTLGCLGGPVFTAEAEAFFVPPGLAKKMQSLPTAEAENLDADDAEVEDENGENGDTVSAQVYHPVHPVHPSLKGLERAYQNMLRNKANERAREVLGLLIEARGGTVPDAVYGLESVAAERAETINADPELRAAVIQHLQLLQEEIGKDESLAAKDKAKLVRSLARALVRLKEGERAENHLRQALRLCPTDLDAYRELNALFQGFGDTSLKVFAKGRQLTFDVPPRTEDNRTLIPFRKLAEVLNGTVVWNPEARTITFEREGDDGKVRVVLQVGSKVALVNGEEVTLDVPPAIIQSRTLVPLRFVAENLGVNVDYLPNMVIIADLQN